MPEGLINFIDSSFIWIISSLNLYEGAERQECLGKKKRTRENKCGMKEKNKKKENEENPLEWRKRRKKQGNLT